MSTESIATPITPAGAAAHCAACGAALARDQRYCLECGERSVPMSSVLAGNPSPLDSATASSPPSRPPDAPIDENARNRHTALTAIAGVGVLLLAMGVGVLIGRAGVGKQSTPPAQVIDVGGANAGTAAGSGTSETTFTSDWPAGTKGFTIELQTLPAGSAERVIQSAKSAAAGKGVSGVGALNAEEFSSLAGVTGYLVYSGVYHTRADATKALAGVKKSFPSASVKEISSQTATGASTGGGAGGSAGAAGGGGGGGAGGSAGGSGTGKSSTPESGKNAKGKSYEEKSKNLPDVVSTG